MGEAPRPDNPSALNPIALCCFGRGGSSLVWNLIGASPDALMTGLEWHQAVFGDRRSLPRIVRALHRKGFAPAQGGMLRLLNRFLASAAADAVRRSIEPGEIESKPLAGGIAIKLMDYHLLYVEAIHAGFARVRPILLTRDPLAQAESCMRSGLTLEAATRWCDDVLRLMDGIHRRWGAPIFRFEDLVAQPIGFVEDFYSALDLRRPADGLFRVKKKDFGASRRGNLDAAKFYMHIRLEEFPDFIDPSVNADAIARLSRTERRYIQEGVRESAKRLGYA